MNYDTIITFNDGSEKIHTILSMKDYTDLNVAIATNQTFFTVVDTDGFTMTQQTNTIKSIKTKETK